jgi:hypothetical protein
MIQRFLFRREIFQVFGVDVQIVESNPFVLKDVGHISSFLITPPFVLVFGRINRAPLTFRAQLDFSSCVYGVKASQVNALGCGIEDGMKICLVFMSVGILGGSMRGQDLDLVSSKGSQSRHFGQKFFRMRNKIQTVVGELLQDGKIANPSYATRLSTRSVPHVSHCMLLQNGHPIHRIFLN